MPPSTMNPTVGAAVLLSNGPGGWDPPALALPSPVLLLRCSGGVTRLYDATTGVSFLESKRQSLMVLEEVLAAIRACSPRGVTKVSTPAFPLAIVAAAFEFGRWFAPHEHAFPRAGLLRDDEFFASIFLDGYRPASDGGREHVGMEGVVPAGWVAGAPTLAAGGRGEAPPSIRPHSLPLSKVRTQRFVPLMSRDGYREKFVRIQEYLAAGDIYQANLTLALAARTGTSAEELFDAGSRRGGAAYAGLFLMPGGTLLSFSPELYLRRRGTNIETRPIKGTRRLPVQAGGVADAREELARSIKERAEHIMIVDLERNDLGRLCLPGSIVVDPLMRVVEHPTVLHMESRVRGILQPDVTMSDLFAATFPGGSVTGAPKKRALEILAELEELPRGIYCGAFGWIDSDGDCELNLPIRTAMLRLDGVVEFHSGGGIVADSDRDEEWEEILLKARFFEEVLAAAAGNA